jgi:hypothetical protein
LKKDLVVHGVDFSGAHEHRRKVWVSTSSEGEPAALRSGLSHADLASVIAASAGDGRRHVWLIDAPFGIALDDVAEHALEPSWPAVARWLASFESPRDWKRACRSVSRKERRRAADRRFHAPLAPMNLRLFKQTWHCVVSVLLPLWERAGVAVLPMALAARQSGGAEGDQACVLSAPVWVGEGCPSSTLRHLGWPHHGYKGPSPANRERREALLDGLEREGGLSIEPAAAEIALDDPEGDALDALILLPSARRFAAVDQALVLREEPSAAVEGWIHV